MLPKINPVRTTFYKDNELIIEAVRKLNEAGLYSEALLAELSVKNIHEEINAVTTSESILEK